MALFRSLRVLFFQPKKGSAHYRANLDAVLAYLLKGADVAAGEALGLDRCGEGGKIIGKRCGRTQNVGGLCGNKRIDKI